MRRALTFAVLLLLLGPCAVAEACSLAVRTPREQVRSARIAVYVGVRSVRRLAPTADGEARWEATVRRLRTFKGRPAPVFRVRSHVDDASCGLHPFKPGQRVGLLLDGGRPPFRIGLDSRISLRDLVRARR